VLDELARHQVSVRLPIRSLREGTCAHAIRLARCCYNRRQQRSAGTQRPVLQQPGEGSRAGGHRSVTCRRRAHRRERLRARRCRPGPVHKTGRITVPLVPLFRLYFGPRMRRDMRKTWTALEGEVARRAAERA